MPLLIKVPVPLLDQVSVPKFEAVASVMVYDSPSQVDAALPAFATGEALINRVIWSLADSPAHPAFP
ncbi:hypothetical protein DSECCO2_307120 [anaerobic digester metagenome]